VGLLLFPGHHTGNNGSYVCIYKEVPKKTTTFFEIVHYEIGSRLTTRYCTWNSCETQQLLPWRVKTCSTEFNEPLFLKHKGRWRWSRGVYRICVTALATNSCNTVFNSPNPDRTCAIDNAATRLHERRFGDLDHGSNITKRRMPLSYWISAKDTWVKLKRKWYGLPWDVCENGTPHQEIKTAYKKWMDDDGKDLEHILQVTLCEEDWDRNFETNNPDSNTGKMDV